eukprot:g3254.t1
MAYLQALNAQRAAKLQLAEGSEMYGSDLRPNILQPQNVKDLNFKMNKLVGLNSPETIKNDTRLEESIKELRNLGKPDGQVFMMSPEKFKQMEDMHHNLADREEKFMDAVQEQGSKNIQFVHEMLQEAKLERKRLEAVFQQSLEQSKQREVALLERIGRQDKLRMAQSKENSELRNRLRQLETEVLDARAWRRRFMEKGGDSTEGEIGVQSGNNGAEISRLLAELSARDEKTRVEREEDTKKKTEMWEEILRTKRLCDDMARQLQQYASIAGDRVQGLEDRVQTKESMLTVLEQRTASGIEIRAMTRAQMESEMEAMKNTLAQLSHQVKQEVTHRTRFEEESQKTITEMRKEFSDKDEEFLNQLEHLRDSEWLARGEDRATGLHLQKFRADKAEHDKDVAKARFERIEAAIREERTDRLAFEKNLVKELDMKVESVEANFRTHRSNFEMQHEQFVEDIRSQAEDLTTMVDSFQKDSSAKALHWEKVFKQGVKKIQDDLGNLEEDTKGMVKSMESVLRAEVKSRLRDQKKAEENVEARIMKERATITSRIMKIDAKANSLEKQIETSEQLLEEKFNSEIARVENDIKVSNATQAKHLATLDAGLQALTVRIDGNAARSRQSLASVKIELNDVRQSSATKERVNILEDALREEIRASAEVLNDDIEIKYYNLTKMIGEEKLEREQDIKAVGEEWRESVKGLKEDTTANLAEEVKDRIEAVDKEKQERLEQVQQRTGAFAADIAATRATIVNTVSELETKVNTRTDTLVQHEAETRIENDSRITHDSRAAREMLERRINELITNVDKDIKEKLQVLREDVLTRALTTYVDELKSNLESADKLLSDTISSVREKLTESLTSETEKRIAEDKMTAEEFAQKLGVLEDALRLGFEQEVCSLAALHRANLQAEAAARLKQDNRTREQFDGRLKSQQEWLLEYSTQKIGDLRTRFLKLLDSESKDRVRETYTTRKRMTDRWQAHTDHLEVKATLNFLIDRVSEEHADAERLQNATDMGIMGRQLDNKIDTTHATLQTNLDVAQDILQKNIDDTYYTLDHKIDVTKENLEDSLAKEQHRRTVNDEMLQKALYDEHVENEVDRCLSAMVSQVHDETTAEQYDLDQMMTQRAIFTVQEEAKQFIVQEAMDRADADYEMLQAHDAEMEVRRCVDWLLDAACDINQAQDHAEEQRRLREYLDDLEDFIKRRTTAMEDYAEDERRKMRDYTADRFADHSNMRELLRSDMNKRVNTLTKDTAERFDHEAVARGLDQMVLTVSQMNRDEQRVDDIKNMHRRILDVETLAHDTINEQAQYAADDRQYIRDEMAHGFDIEAKTREVNEMNMRADYNEKIGTTNSELASSNAMNKILMTTTEEKLIKRQVKMGEDLQKKLDLEVANRESVDDKLEMQSIQRDGWLRNDMNTMVNNLTATVDELREDTETANEILRADAQAANRELRRDTDQKLEDQRENFDERLEEETSSRKKDSDQLRKQISDNNTEITSMITAESLKNSVFEQEFNDRNQKLVTDMQNALDIERQNRETVDNAIEEQSKARDDWIRRDMTQTFTQYRNQSVADNERQNGNLDSFIQEQRIINQNTNHALGIEKNEREKDVSNLNDALFRERNERIHDDNRLVANRQRDIKKLRTDINDVLRSHTEENASAMAMERMVNASVEQELKERMSDMTAQVQNLLDIQAQNRATVDTAIEEQSKQRDEWLRNDLNTMITYLYNLQTKEKEESDAALEQSIAELRSALTNEVDRLSTDAAKAKEKTAQHISSVDKAAQERNHKLEQAVLEEVKKRREVIARERENTKTLIKNESYARIAQHNDLVKNRQRDIVKLREDMNEVLETQNSQVAANLAMNDLRGQVLEKELIDRQVLAAEKVQKSLDISNKNREIVDKEIEKQSKERDQWLRDDMNSMYTNMQKVNASNLNRVERKLQSVTESSASNVGKQMNELKDKLNKVETNAKENLDNLSQLVNEGQEVQSKKLEEAKEEMKGEIGSVKESLTKFQEQDAKYKEDQSLASAQLSESLKEAAETNKRHDENILSLQEAHSKKSEETDGKLKELEDAQKKTNEGLKSLDKKLEDDQLRQDGDIENLLSKFNEKPAPPMVDKELEIMKEKAQEHVQKRLNERKGGADSAAGGEDKEKAEDWEELEDEENMVKYWKNKKTGAETREKPAILG